MQHSAILSTFIKLPFVILKISVFSFFEWLLKTCFTVLTISCTICFVEFVDLLYDEYFLLKRDFFTTKKDGSTALESDGPYFENMGQ